MISETFKNMVVNSKIPDKIIERQFEKELRATTNTEELLLFIEEHRPKIAEKLYKTIPGF